MIKGRRKNHFSGQAVFIYAMLALIVAAYILYFHHEIPNKEKTLHNKGITTLGNIEAGISDKVNHYNQIIDQKIKIESFKGIRGNALTDEAKNIFKDYFDQSLHLDSTLNDSAFKNGNITWVEINDTLNVAYRNTLLDTIAYKKVYEWINGAKSSPPSKRLAKIGKKYSKWTVSIHDFMAGIFDTELFECIVLIDDSTNRVVYSNNKSILGEGAHFKGEVENGSRFGVHVDSAIVNSLNYQEFCKEIEIAGKSFVVLGFMSQHAVDKYTRQVSYWKLILISFITIILICAVPTIKIFILNTWERLKDSDATNSTVGLIALVFFVSLMLSALVFYNQVDRQSDVGVRAYNAVLQKQLKTELVERLDSLNRIDLSSDSLLTVKNTRYHEIFEVPLNKGSIESIVLPLSGQVYKVGRSDTLRNFIYHLFSSNTNISKRKYISELKSNKGFSSDLLKGDSTDSLKGLANKNPFFLESVYSYSRGQTEAVISQVKGDKVRCVSTDLKCLMLNLPPEGFGYALIDLDENVLFSSKNTRNNFRNLGRDISDDGFIRRGMLAETEQTGKFEYGKDQFNGSISPVRAIMKGNNYPLFLLTFADAKIVEWQSGVSTILTAVTACVVPICFVLLILLWRFTKVGRLKTNAFEDSHSFHFLFPDASKMPEYIFLSVTSFIYIIVLHVVFGSSGLRVIVAAIASTIIMYAMIRILLLVSSVSSSMKAKRLYYSLGVLGLAIIISSVFQEADSLKITGLALINMALFISAIIFKKRFNRTDCRNISSRTFYTVSMVLWLVAAVVSPVIVISNWSEEVVESSFKRMASDLYEVKAESVNDKLSQQYATYISKDEWKVDTLFTDSLNRFIDVASVMPFDSRTQRDWVATTFNQITGLFESRYEWQPIYASISSYKREKLAEDYLPAVCFLLLYFLIHFFFKRLFFNVPKVIPTTPFTYAAMADSVEKYTQWVKQNNKPVRMFLVGLPRSRREELVEQITEKSKKIEYITFQWFQNSISDPEDADSMLNRLQRADLVIIDDWYPCNLNEDYAEKLKFLTGYFNEKHAKEKDIVLLSNYTITQMEQKWDDLRVSDAADALVTCIVNEFASWIYSFREFVVPLENFDFDESLAVGRLGMPDVTSYLNKSYYSPAYSSIWNALTQRERFILYDLSDDNLLNTHDRNTLLKLYLKGLIKNNRRQYKLEPFQPSFRLFVKYGVSADELYEIESLSAKNGSWKSVRIGLYLLILALLVFSYKLNPGALKGFGAILGGAISLIGVVSQLSNKISLQGFTGMFKKSQ